MDIIKLHLCGFALGFVLDLIVGDPHWFKIHPVRIMGALIGALDKFFLGEKKDVGHKAEQTGRVDLRQFVQGLFTMALVTLLAILIPAGILYLCYRLNRYLFIIAEALLTCMCLSTASLVRETSPVKKALLKNDIYAARKSLSYVVGRDTERLKETEIIKAVIETLAENLSDGIISPLFYLAVFGPCGGMAFKAISTGDSMIGYKNARYFSFGRAAAKTDDVLNFIPARISAVLIMISAFFIKGMSVGNALRTYKNDHKKTGSPNAGCPESAMAGALGLTLGGPAYYGGRLIDRPELGDFDRQPEIHDITLSQKSVVSSAVICAVLVCLAIWCFCL